MNDHNLDDLIIGDPEPSSKNPKTLLTIIALLIVILIAGLILWALLFGNSDDSSLPSTSQTQKQPLDPDLIPLKPVDHKTDQIKPVKKPELTPDQEPSAKQSQKPVAETKPVVTPTSEVKPAQTQKTITAKPKSPPKTNSESKKTPPKGELIKNADKTIYYIQVGAYKRDPSPKFMKKLKDGGFTFITKTTKGIRRVRVGPYDSYDEAKAALPVVKSKLGIDGLIVKF